MAIHLKMVVSIWMILHLYIKSGCFTKQPTPPVTVANEDYKDLRIFGSKNVIFLVVTVTGGGGECKM